MTNTHIASAQQSLTPGNRVQLFKLDLNPLGVAQTYYFSPNSIGASPIVFGGITYASIPIEATGFETTGQGSLPQPILRIANVNNLAGTLSASFNDLVGALLTRQVTFQQFLDGGAQADTGAVLPITTWEIIQKTKQNKLYMEWRLASLMDQDGVILPKRMVWKTFCSFRYRYWNPALASGAGAFDYTNVTCPYVGSSYFDVNDATVATGPLDHCSKRVSGCKKRFGDTAVLPFGGFIGAAQA